MNYKLLSHILSENTPSYGDRDSVFIESNSSIKKGWRSVTIFSKEKE